MLETTQIGKLVLITNLVKLPTQFFLEVSRQTEELASLGAVINQSLHISLIVLFSLLSESKQLNRVSDQVTFNFFVKGRVCTKRGTVIYF